MAKYNLHIVALPYHDLKGCLGEFYAEVMGQSVTMMQDISNEVDDKAVIVYDWLGRHIGYVSRGGRLMALEDKGITKKPVITGQDNSVASQAYIRDGKQTMTIDKNLKDMAYNTAMIVNSLISNSPIRTSQSISGIPVIYSKITLMTQDSY